MTRSCGVAATGTLAPHVDYVRQERLDFYSSQPHRPPSQVTGIPMLRRSLALAVLLLLTWPRADALRAQPREKQDLTPNSELSLVAASNGLRPGATTTVALRITMKKGWHTYWTNPGDAGLPLAAQWTLPAGVSVSALRLPLSTRVAAAAAHELRIRRGAVCARRRQSRS